MFLKTQRIILASMASVIALAATSAAQAQSNPDAAQESETQLDEIVVTAQKREQDPNDVGLSITAVSGDTLADRGITDPADLARIVPGFTYTRSQFDFPTYTLRGVGYYESSLAASPTVSVYVDEVPLPFPAMTRGAQFDLERVEVLKGPQGILFGQNSTGGAINYIAARPTENFSAGVRAELARFGSFETEAYLSGPLSETVGARLAVRLERGGAYQRSVSRPNDELGDRNFVTGRLLLDFEPSESLKVSLSVNGWVDRSDTQAPQVAEVTLINPTFPLDPRLSGSVVTRENARLADWSPGLDLRRNNRFYQLSLRGDLELSDDITLTSISSYQNYRQYAFQDADGTPARNLHLIPRGNIESFTQELRLAGESAGGRLNWLIGANYEDDQVDDNQQVFLGESTGAFVGPFQFDTFFNDANNDIRNYAVFANAEYELLPSLTVQLGGRYTNSRQRYDSCTLDSGAGDLSTIFGFIQGFLLSRPVTAAPGQCVTLLPDNSTGRFSGTLSQDNFSYRVGINWNPGGSEALLYANVSQGYKSGSFPTLSASNSGQLQPVVQERLVAYEAGFKLPLADNRMQLNGAIFYYDYSNKQLRGRVNDPIFGQLERLVNIPRSRIWGTELQFMARPVQGLTLTANASYLSSRILRNPDGSDFSNFPQRVGPAIPFTGNEFPYTPNWQLSADVDYRFGLSPTIEGFVGAGITYQSRSKAGLEDSDPTRAANVSATAGAAYNDPVLSLPSYTLLDLRAGVQSPDGNWRVALFGRNVTNQFYVVNTLKVQDTLTRYPGRPVEYGITVSTRF
jgi:iron complex outermembrane recepter protein